MLPLRLYSESTVKEHGVLGTGVPTSYSATNKLTMPCVYLVKRKICRYDARRQRNEGRREERG